MLQVGVPVMCAIQLEEDPRSQYRVQFESVPPQGIVEGYQANFSAASGRGAPQPAFRRWTGGDWQPIQLDLEFRAGAFSKKGASQQSGQQQQGTSQTDKSALINELASDMEKKVRLLQAMSFPKPPQERTANQKLLPPAPLIPFVLLVFGDFVTYRGYVTSTQITWKEPWHPVSARPLTAHVSITFQPIMAFYPDFYDVQNPQLRGSVFNAVSALEKQFGTNTLTNTFKRKQELNELIALKGQLADANRAIEKITDPREKAAAQADIDDLTKDVNNRQQQFDKGVPSAQTG